MALTFPLPAVLADKRMGLEPWMGRVLEKAEKVQNGWDADEVHDLRTALRRCRTMADALNEVNPDPGWRKLRKASKDLFRALGDLRDIHVKQEWVKNLSAPGDSLRTHLLRTLVHEEKKYQQAAEKELTRFDRKDWKKLSRKLSPKSQFFPFESVVYQRLTLTHLNQAAELYQCAREKRSSASWHQLRIGLKQFRYVVENFLPKRYEVWRDGLKRAQDLLGDVHDMDVLRSEIMRRKAELDREVVADWLKKINLARKERLQEFRAKTTGEESLWLTWRAGFQWGHTLQTATVSKSRRASYAS